MILKKKPIVLFCLAITEIRLNRLNKLNSVSLRPEPELRYDCRSRRLELDQTRHLLATAAITATTTPVSLVSISFTSIRQNPRMIFHFLREMDFNFYSTNSGNFYECIYRISLVVKSSYLFTIKLPHKQSRHSTFPHPNTTYYANVTWWPIIITHLSIANIYKQ